jgi:hypothetical protein
MLRLPNKTTCILSVSAMLDRCASQAGWALPGGGLGRRAAHSAQSLRLRMMQGFMTQGACLFTSPGPARCGVVPLVCPLPCSSSSCMGL